MLVFLAAVLLENKVLQMVTHTFDWEHFADDMMRPLSLFFSNRSRCDRFRALILRSSSLKVNWCSKVKYSVTCLNVSH